MRWGLVVCKVMRGGIMGCGLWGGAQRLCGLSFRGAKWDGGAAGMGLRGV